MAPSSCTALLVCGGGMIDAGLRKSITAGGVRSVSIGECLVAVPQTGLTASTMRTGVSYDVPQLA